MTPAHLLVRFSASRSHQRGNEMVEFALIALLYFTIIFLIFETGLFIRQYNTVALVAHEGARYACVRKNVTDETIQNFVQQRLNMLGLPGTPGLNITRPTDLICVKVSYSWTPLLPIVQRWLKPINWEKNACMPLMQ